MLSSVLKLISPNTEEHSETLPHDALQVATCVLLLEVASADDEFHDDERDHIVETMQKRFDLAPEDAHELIEYAHHARQHSSDLWKFTNHINKNCTKDEKLQILSEVWRVIFIDGTLDGHEDYIIHKFARLLNLNHPQLIETKLAVLEEFRNGD